jgi:hypothetical protein
LKQRSCAHCLSYTVLLRAFLQLSGVLGLKRYERHNQLARNTIQIAGP